MTTTPNYSTDDFTSSALSCLANIDLEQRPAVIALANRIAYRAGLEGVSSPLLREAISLYAAASEMGRKGGSRPKNYTPEEREKRRQRMAVARSKRKAR